MQIGIKVTFPPWGGNQLKSLPDRIFIYQLLTIYIELQNSSKSTNRARI